MNLKSLFLGIAIVSTLSLFGQSNKTEIEEIENCGDRKEYDQSRFRDPETGYIPENIHNLELSYSRGLKNALNRRNSIGWKFRGPANIGGRTQALGIDVNNEAIILAGSTAGGMWRSTDSGASWVRTTSLSELPNISCLVQDQRKDKTNTWYHGTGELGGNTGAYPLLLNKGPFKWGDYYGNGIYKSTDNGITWKVLASTKNDTIGSLIQPFNFVNSLAVDNSNDSQDVLYAAVAGGIERSTDGGLTWTMVLGDFPPDHIHSDVHVTSTGVVYAVLGNTYALKGAGKAGLYRSVDGTNWVKISTNWKGFGYVSIASAPSNENVLYLASSDTFYKATFFKYTYLSGDGSGSGGLFEDRSVNVKSLGSVIFITVHPKNENVVYWGDILLFRSDDGFSSKTIYNIKSPHVDQQVICFYKNSPNQMLVGSDGGVFRLGNVMSYGPWTSLNSNYATTQFYKIAVNRYIKRDSSILGGLQDNYSYVTHSSDPKKEWNWVLGGDGSECAFSNIKNEYFASFQFGKTYRQKFDQFGNQYSQDRLDPTGSGTYLFMNPFKIDPNKPTRMYFGGGNFLWRHDSLPLIPSRGSQSTSIGWNKLSNSTISEVDSVVKQASISAIAVSEFPSDIVYFGSTDGQVYRIDNANVGNPSKIDIWSSKGFPANAFVSSISIDSRNADRVLLAFANYNVQSLFYTEDKGNNWFPVGGNLEEFSTGKGSGPSIRSVKILPGGDKYIYLVGTSTGLYSTNKLEGMSTVWTLEGKEIIGNSIVNDIDARESDGFVAVATYGIGVFSGNFVTNWSTISNIHSKNDIILYPNPSKGTVLIKSNLNETLKLSITNSIGKSVSPEKVLSGPYEKIDTSHLPAGIYHLHFQSKNGQIIKQLVVD